MATTRQNSGSSLQICFAGKPYQASFPYHKEVKTAEDIYKAAQRIYYQEAPFSNKPNDPETEVSYLMCAHNLYRGLAIEFNHEKAKGQLAKLDKLVEETINWYVQTHEKEITITPEILSQIKKVAYLAFSKNKKRNPNSNKWCAEAAEKLTDTLWANTKKIRQNFEMKCANELKELSVEITPQLQKMIENLGALYRVAIYTKKSGDQKKIDEELNKFSNLKKGIERENYENNHLKYYLYSGIEELIVGDLPDDAKEIIDSYHQNKHKYNLAQLLGNENLEQIKADLESARTKYILLKNNLRAIKEEYDNACKQLEAYKKVFTKDEATENQIKVYYQCAFKLALAKLKLPKDDPALAKLQEERDDAKDKLDNLLSEEDDKLNIYNNNIGMLNNRLRLMKPLSDVQIQGQIKIISKLDAIDQDTSLAKKQLRTLIRSKITERNQKLIFEIKSDYNARLKQPGSIIDPKANDLVEKVASAVLKLEHVKNDFYIELNHDDLEDDLAEEKHAVENIQKQIMAEDQLAQYKQELELILTTQKDHRTALHIVQQPAVLFKALKYHPQGSMEYKKPSNRENVSPPAQTVQKS